MSYRNPLDVFHYDKPYLESKTVIARGTNVWSKFRALPERCAGWRIHNRGGFDIRYAYQDSPSTWEILAAGVADFKSFIPREVWVANEEIVAGRDVDVYLEYWKPEREDERIGSEKTVYQQLREAYKIYRRFLKGGGK